MSVYADRLPDIVVDIPSQGIDNKDLEKESKIAKCVNNYVLSQSNSYSRIVQNDLYDLINNFDKITARLTGKKVLDNTSYNDKIMILANRQCELYYSLGVLK